VLDREQRSENRDKIVINLIKISYTLTTKLLASLNNYELDINKKCQAILGDCLTKEQQFFKA